VLILPAAFFLTAILYAMIGFGGGSTYTAILAFSEMPHGLIPAISLVCNIIVVSGGIWRFANSGHINFVRIWPWLLLSVPAAWVGGSVKLEEKEFLLILGASLFVAGFRLSLRPHLRQSAMPEQEDPLRSKFLYRFAAPGVFGGFLGLLAGLTGIGGGIFLAPLLYFLKWGHPKEIAGACSLFIFANSLAGLFAHISRLWQEGQSSILLIYWPLMISVLAGGAIGSWVGASKLNALWIARLTGILILYVSSKLLMRWWNLA
jgi:uncharacterized membrane protein YfcA